jgi:hypothetical protein
MLYQLKSGNPEEESLQNGKKSRLNNCVTRYLGSDYRVARWYIFKPKIPIFVDIFMKALE